MIPIQLYPQEIIDGMIAYNYSTEDGLPTNQILFSMQDSKGYMWFGTGGGGAVRYDGANFKIFDVSDGLLSNEVYNIYEDHLGRIWFSNYEQQFCYLEDGSIHEYEHNEILLNNIDRKKKVKGIILLKNDDLIVAFHTNKSIRIGNTGIVSTNTEENINQEIYLNKDSSAITSYNSIYKYKSKVVPLNFKRKTQLLFVADSQIIPSNPIDLKYSNENVTQGTFDRKLTVFKNDKIYSIHKDQIKVLGIDGELIKKIYIWENIGIHGILNFYNIENEFWILTRYKGIVIGEIVGDEFVVNRNLFENKMITSTTVDKNNGLWLTTHIDGIIHIPKPKNRSIPKSTKWHISRKNLHVLDDDYFVYSHSPETVTISKEDVLTDLNFPKATISEYIDIKSFDDDEYIYSQGDSHLMMINKSNLKSTEVKIGEFRNNIARASNGDIYVTGNHVINIINLHEIKEITRSFPTRILDLVCENDIFKAGTATGYFEFRIANDSVHMIEKMKDREVPFLNLSINQIECGHSGIWLATNGFGIGYYRDSLLFQINTEDGLFSNQINDLTVDGDTLWVSSNDGLQKLVLNDNLTLNSITNFTTDNGLSSNNVAGVECSKKNIFISTKVGYDIILRADMIGNIDNPFLSINGIRSLKTDSVHYRNINLNYNDNDLRIKIDAIQFNTYGNHQFRYKLKPLIENWKTTKEHHLEFYNLSPDDYTLELEIKNLQGNWASLDSLQFTISPPFWKTWWFISLITVILAISIIGLIRSREKKYREKIEYENELRRLKGKALRAQVNPHFIFNTLNSIQNFVLKGDFEKSNKFITSFSKLIRMILLQSDKDFISLDDEINMLNKYLMIEQMRFGNTFDYKVNVNNSIENKNIQIPPMLIQPFVENAIWHGLLDKKKQGVINIEFKIEKSDEITCIVTDNGIGIEAAEKIKNESAKRRKSVGMSLTNNRLIGLSKNIKNHLTVSELKDAHGKIKGTEVVIIIPITENTI